MDSAADAILLVGLGVLVLVGVFATELAGEVFDAVQQEVKAEEARLRESGEADRLKSAEAEEPFLLGPFNATAAGESMAGMVPRALKEEASDVWGTLNAFAEWQWVPAASQAMERRRRRGEAGGVETADAMPGANSTNPVERFLALLATPAASADDAAEGVGASARDKARVAAGASVAQSSLTPEDGAVQTGGGVPSAGASTSG